MCGIFGAVRSGAETLESLIAVNETFIALGYLSEERGLDSAGVAAISPVTKDEWFIPEKEDVANKRVEIDDCVILKDTCAFRKLDLRSIGEAIMEAQVLLGHTRAATQGDPEDVRNASPILAGALIGTHNGDLDKWSLPHHKALSQVAFGDTDTETMFLALHLARYDRRKMTTVLREMHGRAAIAFMDRSRKDRLYLARGALSPLAFAYDQFGNFYYASNPDWFRRVEKTYKKVTFSQITLVPEGHFLTVNTVTGALENTRRFTPTCRERDLRVMNAFVYRGFKFEDKAMDLTLHRHKVLSSKLGAWPSLTAAPTIEPDIEDVAETKKKTKKVVDTGQAKPMLALPAGQVS